MTLGLAFTSSSSRRTRRRTSFLLSGGITSAGPSSLRTALVRAAEVHPHHPVEQIPLLDGQAIGERQRDRRVIWERDGEAHGAGRRPQVGRQVNIRAVIVCIGG